MPWDDKSTPRHSSTKRSEPVPNGTRQEPRNERSGLSLRLRLTLILLAAFGVIQVALSVAHLLDDGKTAKALFVNEMTGAVESISRQVQSEQAPLSDAALSAIADDGANDVLGQRCAVSVYDQDGMLVASTLHPPIPLSLVGGVSTALSTDGGPGRSLTLEGFPAGGNPVFSRVVSQSIGHGLDRRRVLLIAAPETFIAELLDRATRNIVLLTPIGLVVSAIAGWFIAGFAVRPLRQLGLIASQMRPDNLAQPIDFHSSAIELTSLKQELEQMQRRIESGYEAQERFVANVSHEIKTPIATVLTEAQTLARPGATPSEIRQFIDSTEDEMRRLGRLVESFLMLTRVRHGKPLESTRTTISVNDFVLDSIQHCWKYAEEHGVKLDPELAHEAEQDLTVVGDPDLLRTMVDNLIRNAVRFSPREALIKVVVRTDGLDKVCICVRDKGPGIPDALIDRIFDRFAQGKSEEKLGRGSGLGLEISQGIAELHRGRIAVSNVDDRGCEFCVTLPLAEPLAASASPACTDAVAS